jgi:SAM-dependent methyltransferase
MQAYSRTFARIYNKRWTFFAHRVAPLIADFYGSTPIGQRDQSLLDLCCGTGQLALYFLENGYHVTGIDLSEYVLIYARENASAYVEDGRARFIQADAADFSVDDHFGLVVSTFDALNHLDGQGALEKCFQSVFAALVPGGFFIFDLNTRAGLMRWNNINMDEGEESVIITRGIYDGESDRAYTRVSGFIHKANGLYERFDETVFNYVFDMAWVREALLRAGWRDVYCARIDDLATPIPDPEKEARVFFVANK